MDAWRKVLHRVAEQEIEGVALEAPEDLNDSHAGLTCPACGELDVAVQEVEDAEVEPSTEFTDQEGPEILQIALCNACGAQFTPGPQRSVSPAAEIVGAVIEARRRRKRSKSSVLGILSRDEIREIARRS